MLFKTATKALAIVGVIGVFLCAFATASPIKTQIVERSSVQVDERALTDGQPSRVDDFPMTPLFVPRGLSTYDTLAINSVFFARRDAAADEPHAASALFGAAVSDSTSASSNSDFDITKVTVGDTGHGGNVAMRHERRRLATAFVDGIITAIRQVHADSNTDGVTDSGDFVPKKHYTVAEAFTSSSSNTSSSSSDEDEYLGKRSTMGQTGRNENVVMRHRCRQLAPKGVDAAVDATMEAMKDFGSGEDEEHVSGLFADALFDASSDASSDRRSGIDTRIIDRPQDYNIAVSMTAEGQDPHGSSAEVASRVSAAGNDAPAGAAPDCRTYGIEDLDLKPHDILVTAVCRFDIVLAHEDVARKGDAVRADLLAIHQKVLTRSQQVPKLAEAIATAVAEDDTDGHNTDAPDATPNGTGKQRRRKVPTGHQLRPDRDHGTLKPVPDTQATDKWCTVINKWWKRRPTALNGQGQKGPYFNTENIGKPKLKVPARHALPSDRPAHKTALDNDMQAIAFPTQLPATKAQASDRPACNPGPGNEMQTVVGPTRVPDAQLHVRGIPAGHMAPTDADDELPSERPAHKSAVDNEMQAIVWPTVIPTAKLHARKYLPFEPFEPIEPTEPPGPSEHTGENSDKKHVPKYEDKYHPEDFKHRKGDEDSDSEDDSPKEKKGKGKEKEYLHSELPPRPTGMLPSDWDDYWDNTEPYHQDPGHPYHRGHIIMETDVPIPLGSPLPTAASRTAASSKPKRGVDAVADNTPWLTASKDPDPMRRALYDGLGAITRLYYQLTDARTNSRNPNVHGEYALAKHLDRSAELLHDLARELGNASDDYARLTKQGASPQQVKTVTSASATATSSASAAQTASSSSSTSGSSPTSTSTSNSASPSATGCGFHAAGCLSTCRGHCFRLAVENVKPATHKKVE